jgi:hypothetical protein
MLFDVENKRGRWIMEGGMNKFKVGDEVMVYTDYKGAPSPFDVIVMYRARGFCRILRIDKVKSTLQTMKSLSAEQELELKQNSEHGESYIS